jgi:dienelactone hydrolase
LAKAPGPGVVPPAGVVLPDLSASAANFPPGPEANSPKLAIQSAPGAYSFALVEDVAFPNRTLYVPQGVAAGVKVPIVAWENGMCRQYGRMYQGFLQELASHGYLVIAPGRPNEQSQFQTTPDWQTESVAFARGWTTAPFEVDKTKVALAGHSCGGGETLRNLAFARPGQVTTGIILNSGSSSSGAAFAHVKVPILLVHGGQTDTEDSADETFDWFSDNREHLPIAEVGLQTGHLGSFWLARGGIYAETVVHWLNWNLKGNRNEKLWFAGGKDSPAAQRGWQIQTNHLGDT